MKKLILILALAISVCAANAQVTVVTKTAAMITQTSARIEGTITDPSQQFYTRWFEYGLSPTTLTDTTFHQVQQPTPAVDASEFVFGLSSNTTYYFRLVCTEWPTPVSLHYGNVSSFQTLVNTAIDEIYFLNPVPMNVTIFNQLGQEVLKVDTNDGKFTLPEELHGAYYYLAVSDDGKRVEKGKIFSN